MDAARVAFLPSSPLFDCHPQALKERKSGRVMLFYFLKEKKSLYEEKEAVALFVFPKVHTTYMASPLFFKSFALAANILFSRWLSCAKQENGQKIVSFSLVHAHNFFPRLHVCSFLPLNPPPVFFPASFPTEAAPTNNNPTAELPPPHSRLPPPHMGKRPLASLPLLFQFPSHEPYIIIFNALVICLRELSRRENWDT